MEAFISGTTDDFEKTRQELDHILRSYRQVKLVPFVQENLPEDTAPETNLVRKIIDPLRSCNLVYCFTGYRGGSPKSLDDRKHVQGLAEKYLRSELTIHDFGDLWNNWGHEHGMTYTQLEFFAACSVFKKRTRVISKALPPEDDVDANQRAYLEFLATADIDRTPLENWKVDAPRLAIEVALQFQDSSIVIPPEIPARDAIRQRLAKVLDLSKRTKLRTSGYDVFYREIRQRLTEFVPVLDKKWQPEPVGSVRLKGRPALVVFDDNHTTLAVRRSRYVSLIRFDLSEPESVNKRHFPMLPNGYPIAMLPDCEAILVMAGSSTQLMLAGGEILEVESPALEIYSGYPALQRCNGCIWAAFRNTGSLMEIVKLTGPDSAEEPPKESFVFPEIHFFGTGSVSVSRPGIKQTTSLPINETALILRNNQAFAFHEDHGNESVQLCLYNLSRVIDWFLIVSQTGIVGQFVKMSLEINDEKLRWIIECNLPNETEECVTIELCTATGLETDPIIESMGKMATGDSIDPPPTANENKLPFDFKGKYSWTENGEFLLAVSPDSGGLTFTARAWRFPRPVNDPEFVKKLWSIVNGESEFKTGNDNHWSAVLRRQALTLNREQ